MYMSFYVGSRYICIIINDSCVTKVTFQGDTVSAFCISVIFTIFTYTCTMKFCLIYMFSRDLNSFWRDLHSLLYCCYWNNFQRGLPLNDLYILYLNGWLYTAKIHSILFCVCFMCAKSYNMYLHESSNIHVCTKFWQKWRQVIVHGFTKN